MNSFFERLKWFNNTRLGMALYWVGETIKAALWSWLIWVARGHPELHAYVPAWYEPELPLLILQCGFGLILLMASMMAAIGFLLVLVTLVFSPRSLLKPA